MATPLVVPPSSVKAADASSLASPLSVVNSVKMRSTVVPVAGTAVLTAVKLPVVSPVVKPPVNVVVHYTMMSQSEQYEYS
jgi:hypothetical protein